MAEFGITWPSNTATIIDRMRFVIGRDIIIHVNVSGIACTLCGLDPVTNLSTDPFCAGCEGNYWIATTSAWVCSGHIRWRKTDQPLWTAGGIIDEGDCKVTISNSGSALYNVVNSDHFTVDGIDLYMKNYYQKGVQAINRITIVLLEDPDL